MSHSITYKCDCCKTEDNRDLPHWMFVEGATVARADPPVSASADYPGKLLDVGFALCHVCQSRPELEWLMRMLLKMSANYSLGPDLKPVLLPEGRVS